MAWKSNYYLLTTIIKLRDEWSVNEGDQIGVTNSLIPHQFLLVTFARSSKNNFVTVISLNATCLAAILVDVASWCLC